LVDCGASATVAFADADSEDISLQVPPWISSSRAACDKPALQMCGCGGAAAHKATKTTCKHIKFDQKCSFVVIFFFCSKI
jgi:hypothetical protein